LPALRIVTPVAVYVLPDQRLVDCRPGEAILPAALRAGVAFTHACGGRGKCSTCRVVVVEGREACAGRTDRERRIAAELGFGPEFRLACQTVAHGDVTVRRLVLDEHDRELADLRGGGRRGRRRPVGLKVQPRRRGHHRPPSIGEEMPVAIMFADIRGFTAFAEAVLPYDVIHVLQRHLRAVTGAVERHSGVVTGYLGDGVMALFAGGSGGPASRRAVLAALDILATAEAARPALDELYGRSFDVNAGVHFGTAIVGTVWGERNAVTAIGDTVNVASRVEQANKEFSTRLLVSDAARDDAGAGLRLGRSFTCALPGKAGEHVLYEVLGTT
jgi:adenylate cyclase